MVIKSGSKERLVLELLAAVGGGPRYGLDLVSSAGGVLKRGTVYVLLDQMENI